MAQIIFIVPAPATAAVPATATATGPSSYINK